jgi:hypothetical protein
MQRFDYVDARDHRVYLRGPNGGRIERLERRTPSVREPAAPPAPVHSVSLVARDDLVDAFAETLANTRTLAIEASPGSGTTTLLRQLAARSSAERFTDGAVVVKNLHGASDVATALFAARSDGEHAAYVPDDEDLQAALGNTHGLLLLDGCSVDDSGLQRLRAALPHHGIVVAGSAPTETGAAAVPPLEVDEALAVLEQARGRLLTMRERTRLRGMLDGIDRRPAVVRWLGAMTIGGTSIDAMAEAVESDPTLHTVAATAMAALSPLEQRVLGILAFAKHVVDPHWLASAAGEAIHETLPALAARELVTIEADGVRFVHGLEQFVPRAWTAAETVLPRIVEPLAQFASAAAGEARFLPHAATVEHIVQAAFAASHFEDVLKLGKPAADAVGLAGLFDAWGRLLGVVEQAAGRAGNSAIQAFARSQMALRSTALGIAAPPVPETATETVQEMTETPQTTETPKTTETTATRQTTATSDSVVRLEAASRGVLLAVAVVAVLLMLALWSGR